MLLYSFLAFYLLPSLLPSFSLSSVFVGFGIRVMLIKNKLTSVPFLFLEEITQNWCYFFFKCLVKLTSDTIWTWTFPLHKVFN